MNHKQQAEQAKQRQKMLESILGKQELQSVQKYNPLLAKSAQVSRQMDGARIELLSK